MKRVIGVTGMSVCGQKGHLKVASRCLTAVVAVTVMAACATAYQDATNPITGFTGGYWESKGPGQLVKVGFAGNAYIERGRVGTYLLYRSAEIAKREGKPYFAFYENLPAAVVDKRSSERSVKTVGGKPVTYAYILFFDAPEPGLLNAAEVIARLEPEVKGGPAK
ncbi:MAG: hypothetical protein MUF80_08340 [Burkholderiales bacterium]|jgi:hypothetical protein|nr:hypothetical protein [Burkholderiales bacterium]